MSTTTWVSDDERATLRRLRREGKTVDEIVIISGRSNTTIHQIVRDVDVLLILDCGWCQEKFTHEPRRGRPPGYCSEECRYEAALKRKREARTS